jgi:hypothetical protein
VSCDPSQRKEHLLAFAWMFSAAHWLVTTCSSVSQVAVLELGKDFVRTTLPIVETRSGKKIEYQDEEARKSIK